MNGFWTPPSDTRLKSRAHLFCLYYRHILECLKHDIVKRLGPEQKEAGIWLYLKLNDTPFISLGQSI